MSEQVLEYAPQPKSTATVAFLYFLLAQLPGAFILFFLLIFLFFGSMFFGEMSQYWRPNPPAAVFSQWQHETGPHGPWERRTGKISSWFYDVNFTQCRTDAVSPPEVISSKITAYYSRIIPFTLFVIVLLRVWILLVRRWLNFIPRRWSEAALERLEARR